MECGVAADATGPSQGRETTPRVLCLTTIYRPTCVALALLPPMTCSPPRTEMPSASLTLCRFISKHATLALSTPFTMPYAARYRLIP